MGPLMIILVIFIFAIGVQVINDWDSLFPQSKTQSKNKDLKSIRK
ncbi:Hypothetical protein ADU72_1973 [Pediococcus damnosus]|uniref:Uncharacterized protein n=1 Tax=Pediococcus damnosus TaxID=51663 RepID=A0AAC9FIJ4_9LACO|nr:hypothetical protein [Pediococcus damnosus]AMV61396.1 Hypothetical protein ADU69_1749 [Pediococcus damnosus]AMV62247.1 Hypothetical protein ADU70_0749 [Pediococcus damnosus]AMV65756.1 Hypothetical protein ADU71_1870 [Pediococcus damnosus]AMV67894.1 Hypothetical protein ADU72_1973 [Pediococcus damnosus]AMV70096.1 Hypothetical protein ADU73_1708 [Pediococcus damnosus]